MRPGSSGSRASWWTSGVPEFPPLTPPELVAAMRTVDTLFVVHAEDPDSLRPAAVSRRYADFVSSRPAEAEETAVAAVIRTARSTGRRAHILHLSAASALPLLAAAKRDGGRVTAETCPHYLTLRAEDVPDGATEYKCCPPDPRRRQSGTAVAGTGRGDHRLRRLGSFAVHPGPEAPGRGRLRRGVGRHRIAPTRTRRGVVRLPATEDTGSATWCGGWPTARPIWSAFRVRAASR